MPADNENSAASTSPAATMPAAEATVPPAASEVAASDAPVPGGSDAPSPADFEAERRAQLLTAPGADDRDAAPRIDVTEVAPHTKRIDVRDDAAYRPGG